MNQVLAITVPIFLLIGVGYFAVRAGLVEQAGLKTMAGFVLNFALPALIIRALATRKLSEVADISYFLVYGGASLVVFAGVFLVARRARGHGRSASAIQALGATAANSGFFGYPTAALVLGAPAGVALSLNMAFENIILIPLALALAEAGRSGGGGVAETLRGAALRLVRNPLIIAIVVGALLSGTGLALPAPVARAVDMLANAAGAAALFAIGGALIGLETRGMAGDVGLVVAGKLIAHPLAVFAGLKFAPGLDPALAKAALIFASAPVITIYPLLGAVYGQGRLCAAALMAGTAASFATVSALLYFL
ncbi:MAG TPA: AEC family transporter [Rhodoblastus sp.]|nr:AEC family transporter [Rhodoblastus sp.]